VPFTNNQKVKSTLNFVIYNVTSNLLLHDAGLVTLNIAKGDPFKLTSPAQHALCG